MSANQVQGETLYEIALAITPCESLEATAAQALEAYLDGFDCDVGAVLERVDSGERPCYRVATAVPSEDTGQWLQPVIARASGTAAKARSLPRVEASGDREVLLQELPGFGLLVLGGERAPDSEVREALASLNEKLATTCRHVSDSDSDTPETTGAGAGDRSRHLELLYEEAMSILQASDRECAAGQAVIAAASIVPETTAEIYLYDRRHEALVPVATSAEGGLDEAAPAAGPDHETVVWEVYRSGEQAVINDAGRFEGTLPPAETPSESAVVLPLGDHGVFVVASPEPRAFEQATVEALRLFSTLVEIALDRSKREQGLDGVQKITRTALAVDSHEAVAEAAIERVPELLDFPLSAVWRYDATGEALRPIAWTTKADQLFDEMPAFVDDDSLAWRAYHEGETRIVSDADDSNELYNENTVIGSEIIVPLGEFGVLVTGSTRPESFTDSERRLVETLAANLETALRLIDRRRELDLLDQVLARILRHNIRNDLNLIQGYASQIVDVGDEESADIAERIVKRCRDLEATAEHAREMRQIVRSREQRATLSLCEIIDEAASIVQLEHPGANISADYHAAPTVVAHPDLMTAVRHLLENSIKHHEGDATPVVDVSVDTTADHALLEIEDNGPGIPRSEIEILDKHGESALEHGSGTGLWIVDRVIQYSGATIRYERTDRGTRVSIQFALAS